MQKLPVEIFDEIIKVVVKDNPIKDTLRARLVNNEVAKPGSLLCPNGVEILPAGRAGDYEKAKTLMKGNCHSMTSGEKPLKLLIDQLGSKTIAESLPLVFMHDALRRGEADMVDFLLEREHDMGDLESHFMIMPSLKKLGDWHPTTLSLQIETKRQLFRDYLIGLSLGSIYPRLDLAQQAATMATSPSSVATEITTTFLPPESDINFLGYYLSGDYAGTIVCQSDYEFLISSTYAVCCAPQLSGNCDFRRTCSGTYVSYTDGSLFTCPNGNACVETTVYQEQPSDGWSVTMVWCMGEDNPTSLYRTFVVPADSTATTTTEDTDTSTAEDTRTVTVTVATNTSVPSDTADTHIDVSGGDNAGESGSPESETQDSGSGTNVGAIAGGVVGGVAGLVLIILAVWFIMRRQRKKNLEVREIGAGYVAPDPK
ncbi:hypothetical protein BDW69DRAFT_185658 [Aspergillus filifer]